MSDSESSVNLLKDLGITRVVLNCLDHNKNREKMLWG